MIRAEPMPIPAFLDRRTQQKDTATMTNLAIVEKPVDVLAGLAHEINVRLQRADDHRLSASLKLAEAKIACEEAGVSFKSWVAAEIKQISYPEAARLAKIGAAPEPAKALADMRQKKAEGEKVRRAEKSAPRGALPQAPAAALPRPAHGMDAIVSRVREAITALSGLPPPESIFKHLQGKDEAIIIGEKLPAASQWLAAFANLWMEEKHAEAG